MHFCFLLMSFSLDSDFLVSTNSQLFTKKLFVGWWKAVNGVWLSRLFKVVANILLRSYPAKGMTNSCIWM